MNMNVKGWFGLSTSSVLLVGALTGCGQSEVKTVETKAAAKPFEGKTLTVTLANHIWGDTLKPLIPEFEAATGMKVEVQSLFEDQLDQKLTVQFTSKSSTPDVFVYRPQQSGKLYYKNGWVQPLDEYIKKDAAYDFADFAKPSISSTTVDQVLTGIPIITEQAVLYYRKDLLQNAGIAVPKTLDELEAAAKKLNDPNNGVSGFVARGQRGALVSQVSMFLFSEGGEFMKDGKALVNSEEAIKAFTLYGSLLKNYGPPGVLNMSWPQASGLFAQGKAAFYTDATSIYENLTDPQKSKVSDKVGFALFPSGKGGQQPYNVTSWALAINKSAANKDAAWEFIKWATSKEVTLKTQKKGNPSARTSAWNNPEGTSSFPKELVEVIKESSKIGKEYNRPSVINVGEASDAVGTIVVKAILGENVKDAADKANQELQAIIDKEKSK
jgi:multiple sugar transport system substrate-binding protein